ncbi:MAG: ABC transporter ATP-binding protein [Anaerolineales bacterium]|jgi:oligopeptide transport system ATP-binding protein
MASLLDVRNLTTRFYTQSGVVEAVNGISFSIKEGEIVGVVGESGCGKSVTMRSVMRIIPEPPGKIETGEVVFNNQDLLKLDEEAVRKIRGREIAMIFQDPMTSLNPVLTVGLQLSETLQEHMDMSKGEARGRSLELLELVGIPNAKQRLDEYPYQFSGGMRQRAMIAMALSCDPKLLIADEPTTALDVTIQAQITDLIKELQQKLGMAVIWITHDLGVVARLAQRVIVMYAGYIIEKATVKDLYAHPKHPYTMGLLASLPRLDESGNADLEVIPGQPPNQLALPKGCPFADRCTYVTERCLEQNPALEEIATNHWAACWEAKNIIL